MKAIIVIRSDTMKTDVVLCNDAQQALVEFQKAYQKEKGKRKNLDAFHTFIDIESQYAQVSSGLEYTEIQVCDNIKMAV